MSILQRAHERDEVERSHDGYRVVEPMRPDLRPGESVTWIPEMYCQKCDQPRGVKRCPICGEATVLREDLGEVVLPDLPPGAALDLPLEGNAGAQAAELAAGGEALDVGEPSTAAAPARRVIVDDVSPPPDLEAELGLAIGFEPPRAPAPELEDEPEAPRRTSRFDRALEAREAQRRVEAEATARSRVLDLAARRQSSAPAAAAGHRSTSTPAAPPPAPSIFDQERSSRSAGGRRTVMQQTREVIRDRERELDADGREVQRTLGRNGRKRSIEDELINLWSEAKLNMDHWVQMSCAYAQAGKEPEEAADLADALYMELIRRQRLATSR